MLENVGRLPSHFYYLNSQPADFTGHGLQMIYGTRVAGSVPSARDTPETVVVFLFALEQTFN